MPRFRPSLSSQVMIGLALGIGVGIVFGELVAFLGGVGRAFILLLQMTVLPYLVASLISGLGRLSYRDAGALALRGGAVLLVIWALGLALVLAFPLTLPDWESASFFSTTLIEEAVPFDFLDLYIPSNPFRSLAETIVPAIVVFSVATGAALIGLENKQVLLDPIDAFAETMMRVTQAVARLAPYGVFAITASAAGTLDLGELTRLQIYVISHAVMTLVLGLWLLPGLVTVLTPLRYRDLVGPTRDALLTAFATGSLLIVLPILAQKSKELLASLGLEGLETESSVDVLVPASFNFPNLGKLSALAFVPFGAWYAGTELPGSSYPALIATGLVTFFGNVIVALPFILDVMELPADLFQVFVTVDVLSSRFGALLAAMHTLALTLLGTCAMTGHLTLRWTRIGRYLLLSGGLVVVVVGSVRLLFDAAFEQDETKVDVIANMRPLYPAEPAVVYTERAPLPKRRAAPADSSRAAPKQEKSIWNRILPLSGAEEPQRPLPPASDPPASDPDDAGLERVRTRDAVRVGYKPGNIPFSYLNAEGELVGLDVEMAHQLARELGVALEFVPVDETRLSEELRSGYCDLVMSGVAITPELAREVAFSRPYLHETLALLVRDHLRAEFGSLDDLRQRTDLRIGVGSHVPYYVSKVEALLPDAEVVELESIESFFAAEDPGVEALLITAETGSAWTLLHPEYAVAVPRPLVRVPVAYVARQQDRAMLPFLNAWLALKEGDGTIQQLYDHWMLGRGAEPREPRWSLIRNVLGWGDGPSEPVELP